MSPREDQEFNYWPGVADIFLGFCLLALFLWFAHHLSVIARMSRAQVDTNPAAAFQEENQVLRTQLDIARNESKTLRGERDRLESENDHLRKTLNDKPPVIRLAENEDFRFPSGSAVLSSGFRDRLDTDIFPQIRSALTRFGNVVDTIEIVGHTDSEAVSASASNLDLFVTDVLNLRLPLHRLRAGSNVDLGLMRALAVREVLRSWLDREGHTSLSIRAYSAGPGVMPSGAPPQPGDPTQDENRRRIEIRFLGLGARN
jgi:outer membrane protein OmpA-like peptidoglycan-associated protein